MTKPVFDSMIWSSQNTQYSVLLIIGFLHAEKISTEQLNKEQQIIKTEGWILTLRREALPGTSAKILQHGLLCPETNGKISVHRKL